MGEVYRARDTRPELDREVAIKILAGATHDPEQRRRFELEARTTGSLNHPNILAIYDVGTHEGTVYLVEELLDGTTLREPLQHGPLPPRKAVDYARAIAHGLAAAHAKGITHRDLKPENVMITSDGRVKILDFGLAKLKGPAPALDARTQAHATSLGTVIGTVAYMSPEQVRGQTVDHRSDLFSLGVVLYEMLCGERPFTGATAADTQSSILNGEPPDLSVGRPSHRGFIASSSDAWRSSRSNDFNPRAISRLRSTGCRPRLRRRLLRRWHHRRDVSPHTHLSALRGEWPPSSLL